jgi:hypothetical protein
VTKTAHIEALRQQGFEWIGSGSTPPNKRAAFGSFQEQSNSLKQRRFLCPSTGTANTEFRAPRVCDAGLDGADFFVYCKQQLGSFCKFFAFEFANAPRFYCGAGVGGRVGIVVIGWAGC